MSIGNPTPDLVGMLDAAGRPRSPATLPGHRAGIPPVSKGRRYPADPFRMDELVVLLRALREPWAPGPTAEAAALQRYALAVLLWRTGLRISEALALEERDLEQADRTVLVRRGKGGKRRTVMMDQWAWDQLQPWREAREAFPFGTLFCVLRGRTAGRPLHDSDVRRQMRDAGVRAGLRRRIHPHAFRHTHAIDLWRENIDVYAVSMQLGHSRLDLTALYLRGLGADELLRPIAERRAPMVAFSL